MNEVGSGKMHSPLYVWHGPYAKGSMRDYRIGKHQEAEERNAKTPDTRRRSHARKLGYSRNSQISLQQPVPTRRQRRADHA